MLAMANGLFFYRDAFGGFECDETSFCFHNRRDCLLGTPPNALSQ